MLYIYCIIIIYIYPAKFHLGDGGRPEGRLLVEAPKNITYHIYCIIIYYIYIYTAGRAPSRRRRPPKKYYIVYLYYNIIYVYTYLAELHLGDGGRPGDRLLVEAPQKYNISYILYNNILCIYSPGRAPSRRRRPPPKNYMYILYYNIIYIYTWPSSISATEAVFLLRLAHVPMAPATLNSRDVITCAMKDKEDNER